MRDSQRLTIKKQNSLKCAVCNSKKSRFIKEKEAKILLSQLGTRAPLSNIPLLGIFCSKCIKMNNMINNFLLAVDNFMF